MVRYLRGDATALRETFGMGIIAHVCNNKGGWGAGFVLSVSRKWPEVERRYRQWAQHRYEVDSGPFVLGHTQFVSVNEGAWVANMVAQDGYATAGRVALQYEALEQCLVEVAHQARECQLSVHMPRIGCGLAGGTWEKVGPLVAKCLDGVDVYVYDL